MKNVPENMLTLILSQAVIEAEVEELGRFWTQP